jgi:hypothetical protein
MSKIAFICPTRGRPDKFAASVLSLYEKAHRTFDYVVFAYIDNDDPRKAEYTQTTHTQFVTGPRFGYSGLHEAITLYLIPMTKDYDWIFLWNDDAIMMTESWDVVISGINPDYVLCPVTNHGTHVEGINVFPVIPRQWIDLVGWARNGANDTWWQVIGQMLNRQRVIPVAIKHNRDDLTKTSKDQTRAENNYDSKSFFTPETYGRLGWAAGRIYQALYIPKK